MEYLFVNYEPKQIHIYSKPLAFDCTLSLTNDQMECQILIPQPDWRLSRD